MSLTEIYSKGVKIWIPDQNSVWIGATILEFYNDKNTMKIITDNGLAMELKLNKTKNSDVNFPFLRNPEILIGQKDLTSLSHLNEPEVLYNLQVRFCERREIYTYCGIVLVAINPYQELSIYGNEIINAYHLQTSNYLDPHIFAVAENAFRRMSSFDENQSVIVSGESGAGKTVSAKYTMRYFALVGGSKSKQFSQSSSETQVERKVLLSNPILEAMGNAKTIRNDNSSRFGKYLEIVFSRKNQIIGAYLSTYLLEKSRVVFQNLGERNYHIFYQIVNCSQSGDDLLANCQLSNDPDLYYYLRRGESLEIDGVNDSDEFLETKNSFLQLGISVVHLKAIFEILAAILHLGNIRFKSGDQIDSSTIENPELLLLVCNLLGCSFNQLQIWLCFRSISTLKETLHKPLSKLEARYFRDALVKTIYSNLFDWIVKQVNKSLSCEINLTPKKKSSKKLSESTSIAAKKFIGVLDIYGFETFEENSFEQFCINFANEKLQLQFNMHVFKLEQEEYMNEGLEWTFIDYYNNQPCIDLIESKLGLLDLLDEECKMPKASDENWCCKIYGQHLNKSNQFRKPKLSNSAFIIEHFAGHVEYECTGFIEKNRDSVLEEQINLLKISYVPLVSEIFVDNDDDLGNTNNSKVNVKVKSTAKHIQLQKQDNLRKMKKTVGSQFRNSLKLLMETLNKTNPHYIRCIKPNDLKLPFTFCPERAVQQLRACGVLETIRLCAAGFPSRWTYQEFYLRYYLLISRYTVQNSNAKLASQTIVESLFKNTDTYRFGHNKLFFRAGQVAYLEKLRSDKIDRSVTLIQSLIRGSMERKRYIHISQLILNLQSLIRRKFAVMKANNLRQTRAAIKIQSFYRMHMAEKRFIQIKNAVVSIEYWWRRLIKIRHQQTIKKQHDVIICQSIVRAFIGRRKYLKIRRGIILIQNHYRRRKAKAQLRILKMESKSLDHIKFVNKGLENKIIELTQRLDEKEKEGCLMQNRLMKERKLEIEAEKQNRVELSKSYENTIQEAQLEIIKLKKELNKEISEKNKVITDRDSLEASYKKKIVELENSLEDLKSSTTIIDSTSKFENHDKSNGLNTNPEFIRERFDHQKLVSDYEKLETKYTNPYQEMKFVKSTSNKFTNDSMDYVDARSNRSESESTSNGENADVDSSLSEREYGKVKKQTGTVIAKKMPDDDMDTVGDLAIIMQLQIHNSSISQENRLLKEMKQELETQLLRYKYIMEKQGDLPPHQNGYDNELCLLIKEIKNTDDAGFKSKLIDKIAHLKKQLMLQNEEYQKMRRSIFSGKLGQLADAFDSEGYLPNCEELQMAFESQKEANRRMLKEIEEIKSQDTYLKKELIQLRQEKDQFQIQIRKMGDLIGNFKLTPKERLDKFVQNEISRILIENLRLKEKNDLITSETIQLKRGLKYFAFRLQRYEGSLVPNPNKEEELLQLIQNVIYNSKLNSECQKECYSDVGLIELSMPELEVFIKTFIYDLSHDKCMKHEPYHIGSYIVFLVARKFDVFSEEENLTKFLSKVISAMKRIIMKRKDSIESIAMWMSNAAFLLNLFRQYSEIPQFRDGNSSEENKFNFKRYDLSQFIRQLNELCLTIFGILMQYIFEILIPQSLCVDAILLNEDIQTIITKNETKFKQDLQNKSRKTSFDTLKKHLKYILDIFTIHCVPMEIINQIFVHISSRINAHCLNTLLFRTDLCYFSKGIQIRYNLSSFETWLRDQNLGDGRVLKCLQPINEAVQLLQTLLKTEDDAQIVYDTCEYLNTSQILKILHNFNPRDGYGYKLPIGLISRVESLMNSKRPTESHLDELQTPTAADIPIEIPFIHNKQPMNQIIIPKHLCLPCLTILTKKDLV